MWVQRPSRIDFVYFDMDGAFADFRGGSVAMHGLPPLPPTEGDWDFMTPLGFDGPSCPRFWAPLYTPTFWANLAVLQDGMALFRLLEEMVTPARIRILSNGQGDGACDGKRTWLRRHLPEYEKTAIFAREKFHAAGPHKLLVDDQQDNIDAFLEHGGAAILVPRPWNKRRDWLDANGHFDPQAVLAEIMVAGSAGG